MLRVGNILQREGRLRLRQHVSRSEQSERRESLLMKNFTERLCFRKQVDQWFKDELKKIINQ
jgi:hypothetical protein